MAIDKTLIGGVAALVAIFGVIMLTAKGSETKHSEAELQRKQEESVYLTTVKGKLDLQWQELNTTWGHLDHMLNDVEADTYQDALELMSGQPLTDIKERWARIHDQMTNYRVDVDDAATKLVENTSDRHHVDQWKTSCFAQLGALQRDVNSRNKGNQTYVTQQMQVLNQSQYNPSQTFQQVNLTSLHDNRSVNVGMQLESGLNDGYQHTNDLLPGQSAPGYIGTNQSTRRIEGASQQDTITGPSAILTLEAPPLSYTQAQLGEAGDFNLGKPKPEEEITPAGQLVNNPRPFKAGRGDMTETAKERNEKRNADIRRKDRDERLDRIRKANDPGSPAKINQIMSKLPLKVPLTHTVRDEDIPNATSDLP